ncbi:androgen-dependent TFPI-regulating protein-like [Periplaneta americana]|uniref:androgen-dependent TFPI-regulating protein-like n=1 Tax=Periplaneta americana TaxID=6978 RepID=UPI0037E73AD9
MGSLQTTFRCLVLLHHLVVMCWLHAFLDGVRGNRNQFVQELSAFRGVYFTTWNFVTQIVYFSICVGDAALGTMLKPNVRARVKRLQDFTFTTLVFPFTMFVSTFFWTLFMMDREMVFPKSAEILFPWWMNHSMHSVVLVVVILETLLCRHQLGASPDLSLVTLFGFFAAYDVVFVTTNIVYGVWLYPVFRILGSWSLRLLLLGTANLVILGFYVFGVKYLFPRHK